MSTLENTVSMMKTLPEADLLKIQKLTLELFQGRRGSQMTDEEVDEAVGRYLKPKSREDIYRELEISRQQAAEGKYREAGEFLAEFRAEYGI